MLRIAVVEDDASALTQLQQFLSRYQSERGIAVTTSSFQDGSEILADYHPVFDVIFLDIEMPQVDGMSAAEAIRQIDQNVVIIFITNMAQYAVQGYSVGALDFVVKPVSYYTFRVKLDRAVQLVDRRKLSQITLTLPEGVVRLGTRQIYYVEIQDRRLHYHTDMGVYTLRGSMKEAEAQLSAYNFVRCNYWYLVNLYHVVEVKKDVVVVGGHELEISRRTRTAFMTSLTNYLGGGV